MKKLTVIFTNQQDGGVLARGIAEDETVFNNAHFESIGEFASYAQKVLEKSFAVTYNSPDDWKLPRCVTKDCPRVVTHHRIGIGYTCTRCFEFFTKVKGD